MSEKSQNQFGDEQVNLPEKADFLEMMGGDADLCVGILESAQRETKLQRRQIEETVTEGDLPGTLRLLHSLRGSAATLGATQLAEVIRVMEADAEQGNITALRARMPSFKRKMEGYSTALDRLLAEF